MGNGMTCRTTKNSGAARCGKVRQKQGLPYCRTTPTPKGVVGGGAATGCVGSAVRQWCGKGGAQ